MDDTRSAPNGHPLRRNAVWTLRVPADAERPDGITTQSVVTSILITTSLTKYYSLLVIAYHSMCSTLRAGKLATALLTMVVSLICMAII